ncbi:site-specific integrase [Leptolyngbya sp. FACHB-36]|uniref:site-specific integrase n=1 Tax=Leptolyngbya sp. FACHB-36 TaxID=2692808 RepID=UPI0016803692|nr:site-specific integrase [Leptolyngbya sp. FACHB-36]MBD2019411.1 site-specific integrase [Leptolyngbya sp. FACHB-36]
MKAKLDQLNTELKAAKIRVAINLRNDRLYLRATLPPKPDSNKTEWHQQEIAIGVYANPAGLKRAKIAALEVSSEIAMGQFSWDKYLSKASKRQTVADWAAEFEARYFQERSRTPKTETTWQKDYAISLRKLPAEKPLTAEVLLEAIAQTEPDTRTRKRVCMVFGQLAKLAGIELKLDRLRGSYSPRAVQPRDLPSDQLIVEWRDQIEDPAWQWVYGMLATYGLRNHEVFLLDLESLKEPPGALTVLDGKTGGGRVYPFLPEWWELWNLADAKVPNILPGKDHSTLGMRVTKYFARHNFPFTPYALRHAWAVRTAVLGLDPSIAAKMMRHDLTVHFSTYHQFLDDNHMLAAWKKTNQRT